MTYREGGVAVAWCVYILRCRDGSLYTGCTNDIAHRLAVHQSGKGAKYTRSRLPVCLVYQEEVAGRSEALRRENAIKRLTREQKLRLLTEQKISISELEPKTHRARTEKSKEMFLAKGVLPTIAAGLCAVGCFSFIQRMYWRSQVLQRKAVVIL